jgi:uncharacterized damage-inducible protein DinB
MSMAQQAVIELQSAHEYFNPSTRSLSRAHSTFAPAEGMMTAAQQVAHVAHTIDWFLEGAFRPEGFDMNWEEQAKVVGRCTSLEQARAWFERAVAGAITDHTAHHRGALTVYARLNGIVPPMAYMEA